MTKSRIATAVLLVSLLVPGLWSLSARTLAAGPTNVSGAITTNTTWTPANSPYIVTGSVRVNSGVTLRIEPGVQVRFNGAYRLLVEGELIAIGTPQNHIVFTSNMANPAPADWIGIIFADSSVDAVFTGAEAYSSGSTLQYAEILYGGTVLAYQSTPYLGYSRFAFNWSREGPYPPYYSWDAMAITLYNAPNSRFRHNLVEHNLAGGLKIEGNTQPVFVEHNLFLSNDGGQYSAGIASLADAPTIRNNVFAENRARGYIPYGNTAELSGNTFVRNQSFDNGGTAFGMSGHTHNIHHNTMVGNSGPATLHLPRSSAPVSIVQNNIVANSTTYDGYLDYIDLLPGDVALDMRENFWGLATLPAIQARFNRYLGEYGDPMVLFSPFRTSPVLDAPVLPPANLVASGSNPVTLSWQRNAESDVVGYRVYYDTDAGYPYANSVDAGNNLSKVLANLPAGVQYFAVTAYDAQADGIDDFTDGHESWFSEQRQWPEPTPTPTVTPTPEPTPTDAPTPEPTAPPISVDTPTSEPPTPTPTLEPTVTATPSPTLDLDATPLPTPTPEAGGTPTPTRPPFGASINNGALFTNQVAVTLSLWPPPGGEQMMVSNDGGFQGAQWEPFAASRTWTITAHGDYVIPRTVYVRYGDAGGTLLVTVQDDIILDVTAPTGSVAIEEARASASVAPFPPGVSPAQNDHVVLLPLIESPSVQSATLRIQATDDVSGVVWMALSSKPNFAGSAWKPYTQVADWRFVGTSATTVYIKFMDRAGNESQVYSDSISIP